MSPGRREASPAHPQREAAPPEADTGRSTIRRQPRTTRARKLPPTQEAFPYGCQKSSAYAVPPRPEAQQPAAPTRERAPRDRSPRQASRSCSSSRQRSNSRRRRTSEQGTQREQAPTTIRQRRRSAKTPTGPPGAARLERSSCRHRTPPHDPRSDFPRVLRTRASGPSLELRPRAPPLAARASLIFTRRCRRLVRLP